MTRAPRKLSPFCGVKTNVVPYRFAAGYAHFYAAINKAWCQKRPRTLGRGAAATRSVVDMHELFALNTLSPAQRERILERLRQGRSLRAIEAETGHRRETISRYGREAGLLAPIKRRAGSGRSTLSSHLRLVGAAPADIRIEGSSLTGERASA
jgi:hypothetical protein